MAKEDSAGEGGDKSGDAGAGEAGKAETVLGAASADAGKADATKVEPKVDAAATKDGKPAEKPAESKPAPFDAKALKFPEGHKVEEAALKGFTDLAQKHGASTEFAQALVDFNLAQAKAQGEALDAAWKQEAETANAKALETLKKDSELGGSAWKASQQHMKVALEKFGSAELRKAFEGAVLLDGTKLGNSPEVARFFARVGKALAEDSLGDTVQAGNGKARTTEEERLRALYPKSPELFAKE